MGSRRFVLGTTSPGHRRLLRPAAAIAALAAILTAASLLVPAARAWAAPQPLTGEVLVVG